MDKFKHFFRSKRMTVLPMIADAILFFGAFSLSYVLHTLNIMVHPSPSDYGVTILLALPCLVTTLVVMTMANVYRIIWRYAGTMELLRLILVAGVALAFGLLFRGLFSLAGRDYNVPNPLVVLSYMLFFFFGTLYRVSARLSVSLKYRMKYKNSLAQQRNRVLVYGAGYTGAALVKRFLDNPDDGYVPVAMIDDDIDKKGSFIGNLMVEGNREVIASALKKHNANVIAIAITRLGRNELRSIFDYIKQFDVRIMITTSFRDAQNEINSDIVSIRNIKIEDLLHRDEHTLNRELVDGFIKNKVVMVTGGAGSIGSELCRQALIFGCKTLVVYDHFENGMFELNEELKKKYPQGKYFLEMGSVRDKNKLHEVMERYKPNVVFHAAAYKHVPMMEISADESVKNNVFGTKNVFEQCNASGVEKFILISTDKAINPANVMGATKRVAELCLQDASKTSSTQLAAVRFGNVLGSSGSVIPTFIRQINEGGPITVTDKDMKRYFMTIPEAVRLVLQAGALASGGEVFVLDMGEPVYIYDLARDLIRMSGLIPDKDIDIKISGLRPGEKLFEELQYGDENVDATTHNDIFVCKLGEVDTQKIQQQLQKLWNAADKGDKDEAEKLLFELVPSDYRTSHKDTNARV